MNNFETASDFEINKELAGLITDGDVISRDDMFPAPTDSGVQVIYKLGFSGEFYDYCNNWSDIGPLIERYGVTVSGYGDARTSTDCIVKGQTWSDGVTTFTEPDAPAKRVTMVNHTNPKRAAAICIIKLLSDLNE